VRVNTTKQKMAKGEPAFGYALGLGCPEPGEVLANCGIDFIMIDTQHGSWGPDSTINTLRALAAGSATPVARVVRNEFSAIGRLLDEGVMGMVVPMVHTRADAEEAAAAMRFPPVGKRSWGWGRAWSYGWDYPYWINDQVFLAVQIESAQAVQNAEAILSTPGVDGCWIGPSDLALSMGISPKDMNENVEHQKAVEKTLQACKNTGKFAGYACGSVEQAALFAARGFQFLTAGSDIGFLLQGAAAGLKTLSGWQALRK
jgi:4-hydroxy-2-oxoheptanedioate aldolase